MYEASVSVYEASVSGWELPARGPGLGAGMAVVHAYIAAYEQNLDSDEVAHIARDEGRFLVWRAPVPATTLLAGMVQYVVLANLHLRTVDGHALLEEAKRQLTGALNPVQDATLRSLLSARPGDQSPMRWVPFAMTYLDFPEFARLVFDACEVDPAEIAAFDARVREIARRTRPDEQHMDREVITSEPDDFYLPVRLR